MPGKIFLKGLLFQSKPFFTSDIYDTNVYFFLRFSVSQLDFCIDDILYQNTDYGDLSSTINEWFDTHTGKKIVSLSYTKISQKLMAPPQEILFISDSSKECDAAREAGMRTLFSLRNGNPDQDPQGHTVIRNLTEVDLHL